MKDCGMLNVIKGLFSALVKGMLLFAGSLIVLLSIALNGAHFIINLLPDKNQFVAAVATGLMNQPVTVRSVRLEGSAIHPLVVLTGVSIGNQKIKHVNAGLNLWRSLLDRAWVTDHIFVSDVSLASATHENASLRIQPRLVNWVMHQPDIAFQQVNLDWKNDQHKLLRVRHLALRFQNEKDKHIFAGHFMASSHQNTIVRFVLKAHAKNIADPKARGILYLSGKQVDLAEWISALHPLIKFKQLHSINGVANVKAWVHFQNRQLQSIQMHAMLSGFGVRSHQTLWAVTPITVDALWFLHKNKIGAATFQVKNATLSLSGLFSHKIPNVNLNGKLMWVHQHSGWVIRLKDFDVQDLYFRFHGGALARCQPNQSPYVNFVGHAALSDVRQVSRYLPDRILTAKLDQWLTKSLLRGRIAKSDILFQGPVADFPFDKGNGHFEVSAELRHIVLHFLNGWPSVSHLNGHLMFDGRSMQVIAKKAKLANLQIGKVTANIPNLSRANLLVDAASQMNLSDGVVFLRQSQLPIAKDMRLLEGAGPTRTRVHLRLPLYAHHVQPDVRGKIDFLRSTLAVPKWSMVLQHLTGSLLFNNQNFSSHNLHAVIMREPFAFDVHTDVDKHDKSALLIDADGKVDASSLSKRFLKRTLSMVSGRSLVHVGLVLHDITSPLKNTINIVSNLQGISIVGLPALFLKSADKIWPSRLELVINKNKKIMIAGAIGDLLSGQFLLKHGNKGLHFVSGQLSVGGDPAVLPKKMGLYITGALSEVNWMMWKNWFKKTFSSMRAMPTRRALPDYLKNVSLNIGDLVIGKQHWRDLFLSVSSLYNGTRIQVQNENISGQVLVPFYTYQTIKVDFDYLFLQPLRGKKHLYKKIDVTPSDFPPLDIHISDFRMHHILDGEITLKTAPMHDGLLIKQLLAKSSLFNLSANGRWIDNHGAAYTALTGHFDSDDLGGFLLQRHFSSRLKGGVLTTRFSLNWLGSPTAYKLKNMSGKLSVGLTSGRIMQLGTETESNLEWGRLLNILSLESISKFLTFDFSSVTKKGFPFHTLSADLAIKHGDVITNNMEVDGPLAHVSVAGKIGLTSQKNNLSLSISPYVSSSLPFIVGLAGGPVAGVATWVVNKIVGRQVGHMMQVRYRVTGTWQHPVVKKVIADHPAVPT